MADTKASSPTIVVTFCLSPPSGNVFVPISDGGKAFFASGAPERPAMLNAP